MKPALALTATLLLVAAFSTQALPPAPPLTGEVVESRDVQGYTYLRIKTASGETWAAVPTSVVKLGSQIGIANPVTMQNFESKTLNKRFDKIVFGQILDPLAKPAAPASAEPASASAIAPAITTVTKAVGPDAKTVAEVVTGKAGLKDKTVLVHAQVVKASTGILGKNWLHLRDGSGSAAAGTHDVLVTTLDNAAVGDIVNARGKVRTNVDLGSGYAYAVLIEDASLRK
jgi:hypothetical protein